MKLAYLVLGAMTLLLLGGYDSVLSTSGRNLHTFVGCAVREFTFLAKKPGCRGLRITTDACWGRCKTWEVRSSTGLDGSVLRASSLSSSVLFCEGKLACLPCPLDYTNPITLIWFFQMIWKPWWCSSSQRWRDWPCHCHTSACLGAISRRSGATVYPLWRSQGRSQGGVTAKSERVSAKSEINYRSKPVAVSPSCIFPAVSYSKELGSCRPSARLCHSPFLSLQWQIYSVHLYSVMSDLSLRMGIQISKLPELGSEFTMTGYTDLLLIVVTSHDLGFKMPGLTKSKTNQLLPQQAKQTKNPTNSLPPQTPQSKEKSNLKIIKELRYLEFQINNTLLLFFCHKSAPNIAWDRFRKLKKLKYKVNWVTDFLRIQNTES